MSTHTSIDRGVDLAVDGDGTAPTATIAAPTPTTEATRGAAPDPAERRFPIAPCRVDETATRRSAEPEPRVDATAGIDPLTGLLDRGRSPASSPPKTLRVQRYHRPATVVIFELGGLDRLDRPARRRRRRSRDPGPGRHDAPARPRRRPRRAARLRAGSGSSCPRPTRSRRSTTSSGSAGVRAVAGVGRDRAQSRGRLGRHGRRPDAFRRGRSAWRPSRMYAELRTRRSKVALAASSPASRRVRGGSRGPASRRCGRRRPPRACR